MPDEMTAPRPTSVRRPPAGRLRRWAITPVWRGLKWFPSSLGSIVGLRFGVLSRGRALITLPAALLAFLLSLLVVFLVYSGWMYPARFDVYTHLAHPFTPTPGLDGAWGGNTLVGAWLAHTLIAIAIQAVSVLGLKGLLRVHDAMRNRDA